MWLIKMLKTTFLSLKGHEHPRLMSVGLIAQQLHWVSREPITEASAVLLKHDIANLILRGQ